jgi:hypothetical protein
MAERCAISRTEKAKNEEKPPGHVGERKNETENGDVRVVVKINT